MHHLLLMWRGVIRVDGSSSECWRVWFTSAVSIQLPISFSDDNAAPTSADFSFRLCWEVAHC